MNSDRNGDVPRNAIRQLAIASICLSLLVFPLGPVTIVLNDLVEPPTSLFELLTVFGVLLPIAGVICGHVALKRIAALPNSASGYRRLAMAGTITGYVLVAVWFLLVVVVWFYVLPNAFNVL